MYKAIHQSTRQPLVACPKSFIFCCCGCQSSKISEPLSSVAFDLSPVADGGMLYGSVIADEGSANLADVLIIFFRFRLYFRLSLPLRIDVLVRCSAIAERSKLSTFDSELSTVRCFPRLMCLRG